MPVETMQVPRQNPRMLGAEDRAARRIAYERARRGWSNAELAKRMTDAGVPLNQSAIQKIERGTPRRTISIDEALAFAEVFGLSSVEKLWSPPPEVATEDLARFLEDSAVLEADLRAILHRVRDLSRGLLDLGRGAGPLLEYLGISEIALPSEDLVRNVTECAKILLAIRDDLAETPLKLTRGSDES